MSVPQKELAFRVRLLVNLQNVFPDVNDGDFRFRFASLIRGGYFYTTMVLFPHAATVLTKKHSIS